MPVLAPAEMFTTARRKSDREGGIRKPLHKQKDEGGRGPPACNHLGQVDAEVKEQIRIEALPVFVDQPCEAEASPAWVLDP
ncbi:hypothetical protein SAMN05216252_106252 [Actinacidiphila glaucinigra]|uniref:Uncharacterized protein n=1 Tax=Actinacidiphila glaucinigra TaxID=235986 RepID=A0A239F0Q0_9ACTN|nr:hypothetical protein SAMN05216252_106252 [Actinacidiphila glaucinigra]